MPIVQAGALNTTALVVPDLYVQIVPPQNLVINGVPTNVIGVVGTASWGPKNQACEIGTMAEYSLQFGSVMPRTYDMGTAVAIAVQQGAQAFECVRVTDGTDVQAQALFNGTAASNCSFIATSLYSGSAANGDVLTLSQGAGGTYNLTISRPGVTAQLYTGLTGTGAAFWTNLIAAVNTGVGQLAGPSQLVTLSAGAGASASVSPSSLTLPMSITLGFGTGSTAGSDGVGSITSSVMVGQDTIPRTGMYCLRGQGCSIGMLADVSDSTTWAATQDPFGLSEGIYMMLVAPPGSVIQNGSNGTVDLKNAAGLNDYACKLLHGDWIWWQDQVNNVLRLVSPQAFAAGRLANLSPEQSGLNKPIYGIVASQKSSSVPGSSQANVYAMADLQLLIENGIDVICNPQPGGYYWGLRAGHNSSTNASINGDNYTRLTNYISASLAAGMGTYVGQVINSTLFQNIRATLLAFLQNMLSQGLLGSLDGSTPFSVICDTTNNPLSRTSIGYVQADVQVQYQGINEKFIVNLQGGTTVQVTTQTLPTGQVSS